MKRRRAQFRNRPGAALAVVAVSLVGMLAMMALAIDMGMMYAARNEAQRVADAAALAGASAFLDYPISAASGPARTRAHEYVMRNYIMTSMVDSSESNVTVVTAQERVRVAVKRRQISTWFARLFGVDTVTVAAAAVAEAVNAGGAKCVRPWAVQDIWHEQGPSGERLAVDGDVFNNGGDGDRYRAVPVNNINDPTATGYGSQSPVHAPSYDFGRQITLKAQAPNTGGSTSLAQPGPAEFLIWQMPQDPTQASCPTNGGGGGGNSGGGNSGGGNSGGGNSGGGNSGGGNSGGGTTTSPGAAAYRQNICSCNKNTIELGVQYPLEFGNVVGPGFQGVQSVMDQDPNAHWSGNQVVGSVAQTAGQPDSWKGSPRIVPIALMAPLGPPPGQSWNPSALTHVTFTNIALFFIEGYNTGTGQNGQPSITGRFLYYAAGVPGHTTGSTVKYVRLVE